MNGTQYVIVAYAVGLGLMLGYGILLCIEGVALRRRLARATVRRAS